MKLPKPKNHRFLYEFGKIEQVHIRINRNIVKHFPNPHCDNLFKEVCLSGIPMIQVML